MDMDTLIKDLALALATDTPLQSWAQEHYGAPARIFINIDERDPPGADQMPCVLLYPAGKQAGRGRQEKQYQVAAECLLADESRAEHPSELIIEYKGVSRIEKMRALVLAASAGVDTADALLDAVDTEYDTISFFPLFTCTQVLTFAEQIEIGGEYLE